MILKRVFKLLGLRKVRLGASRTNDFDSCQGPKRRPGKLEGVLARIVVKTFKDNARKFTNLTTAVTFEACKRRLRLYFSDLKEVKERIIAGKIIDLPYVTFQRDRRINKEKRIKNDQRRYFKYI